MARLTAQKKERHDGAPSPADEADARGIDRAVQTMIDGPLSEWNVDRPLASLNRQDLRRLAVAAVTGWVLNRAAEACAYDPISDALAVEPTSGRNP